MTLPQTDGPLYRQLQQELVSRIAAGIYPRGSALPSASRLSEEFGVSLITVRRALHELTLDGLVESRQGLGCFVRGEAQNVEIGLSSFTSDVAAGRLRLVRSLLLDETVAASPEVAPRLGVQAGSLLRHLVRLDVEGTAPLSIDEVFIAPALAVFVTNEMASSPLFVHLWQLASGIHLVSTSYDISVEMPGPRDQAYLGVGPGDPLLVTHEVTRDAGGTPQFLVVSRYRSDRCRLTGTVSLVQRQTERGVLGE